MTSRMIKDEMFDREELVSGIDDNVIVGIDYSV